jgi:hypothetical protein
VTGNRLGTLQPTVYAVFPLFPVFPRQNTTGESKFQNKKGTVTAYLSKAGAKKTREIKEIIV